VRIEWDFGLALISNNEQIRDRTYISTGYRIISEWNVEGIV
jgi:hypothetical protein